MTDEQAEIEHVIRARNAAIVAADGTALESLIAPDAIVVHGSGGVETGTENIELIRQGKYRYRSLNMADPKIRVIGDVAVVTGRVELGASTPDGAPVTFALIAVIVWERRDGRWMMIHYQATPPPAA